MVRHAIYLPLAYVAGVHGFAILAPYLALCVTAQTMIVQRRQRRATLAAAVGDVSTGASSALAAS